MTAPVPIGELIDELLDHMREAATVAPGAASESSNSPSEEEAA